MSSEGFEAGRAQGVKIFADARDGMVKCVNEDGQMIWSQAVGLSPDQVWPDWDEFVTAERAAEVRQLRDVEHRTWRDVAGITCERWGGNWDSNQIAGQAICIAAAKRLGEKWA